MLTFEFTGVEGQMTENEVLTSGMVGKEVRLLFDSSWSSLTKTAVFRAGETTRVVMNPGATVTVPDEVLRRPFCKLYVGVYGTDSAGTLVIPTVMAEGPLIRYGADPIEDETARELPVWQELQNQIGNTAALNTNAKDTLVAAINEVLAGQDCIGDTAALNTGAKNTLVAAVNEVLAGQDCIGDTAALNTGAKNTLVAAVNEVLAGQNCIGDTSALNTNAKNTLVAAINEVLAGLAPIGDLNNLNTDAKNTLVAAVNAVLAQLEQHIRSTVSLTPDTAQLLVDILSEGSYRSDQTEAIAALAASLGASVPEKEELVLHWDFRSSGLTDQVAGLEATCSGDVTLDAGGAHIGSATSYLMFPLGTEDAPLGSNVVEIKFGTMNMTDVGTMRLAMITNGTQPASTGLMWNSSDCWAPNIFDTSEFTDLNMFSGKVLTGRSTADGRGIEWYLEDTLICTVSIAAYQYTQVSLGSSASAAYPFTVEYVKVRPGA